VNAQAGSVERHDGRGHRGNSTLRALGLSVALVILAYALHKMSVLKPLDHDEHQFIASGATWARHGWLPYRDVPHHHLPYLSFLYATIFSLSDSLLGPARAVSVAGSLGIALLTGYASAKAFEDRSPLLATAVALLAVVVLIANPIFVYTSGRAWNHDLAALLTIAAALVHMRWLAGRIGLGALAAGGAALGLAVGMRSSFALVIPAFAASFLFLGPADKGERARATAAFAIGGFVSLAPVLVFIAFAPEQFAFGNFRYNTELNTEYRRITEWSVAMDLTGKLTYLRDEVLSHRRNSLLAVLYLIAVGSAGFANRGLRSRPRASKRAFLGMLLAFLLLAAWSPTPTWYQYFFPVIPFLIIGSAEALAGHPDLRSAAVPSFVVVLLALTSIAGLRHYVPAMTGRAGDSRVEFTRIVAAELAQVTEPGRVATLGPIFALEAGREIYPWLATGPFSFRTAALVEPGVRATYGIVSADELDRALKDDPPVAILTGIELGGDTEAPFSRFARRNGMRPHELSGGLIAWVPRAR